MNWSCTNKKSGASWVVTDQERLEMLDNGSYRNKFVFAPIEEAAQRPLVEPTEAKKIAQPAEENKPKKVKTAEPSA